ATAAGGGLAHPHPPLHQPPPHRDPLAPAAEGVSLRADRRDVSSQRRRLAGDTAGRVTGFDKPVLSGSRGGRAPTYSGRPRDSCSAAAAFQSTAQVTTRSPR